MEGGRTDKQLDWGLTNVVAATVTLVLLSVQSALD